jgi:hypothetical protein
MYGVATGLLNGFVGRRSSPEPTDGLLVRDARRGAVDSLWPG